MTTVKKAILCRRFIDGSKPSNNPLSKQSRPANEWCSKNNAEIVDVATEYSASLGLGECSDIYALSTIIKMVENGTISSGTYLLVDNLDISRHQISKACAVLSSILELGINIVTLRDGSLFTKESLDDLGDLTWVVASLALSNEDSRAKSRRISSSWEDKRREIEVGNKPKVRSPKWVTYNEDIQKYELNEYAIIVETVFDVYLETLSMNATAKKLNEMEVPTLRGGNGWGQTSVRFLLGQKSVFGQLDAKTVQYDDFYPAAVSKEKYYLAQSESNRRSPKRSDGGKTTNGKTSNLLTRIGRCGVCGETMFMHGKMIPKSTGELGDYRYLNCSSKRFSERDCGVGSFRYKYVEAAILLIASHLKTLPKNSEDNTRKGYLRGRIDSAILEMEEMTKKKAGNLKLMEDFPEDEMIRARYFEVTSEIDRLNNHIDEMSGEISKIEYNNSDDNFITRLPETTHKLNDEEYRAYFMNALHRVIDKCEFRKNGTLHMKVMGVDFDVLELKPYITIRVGNRVIREKSD